MTARQPNVLLIMSDQHNSRVMGCAGDPVARTPALDGLARRGVRFSNAYCAFPLCGPSRMAFMTARLPSSIDCMDNASQLCSDVPTFAHAFSAGGYETVLAGRMHFVGPDQRHGFQHRLISDVTTAWVNRGWDLEPVLGDLIDTPGYSAQSLVKSGAGRTGYHAFDEAVTRASVTWLEGQATRTVADGPFLLVVGYVSPHSPYVAPPEFFDAFRDRVPPPRTGDEPAERLHPECRLLRSIVDDPDGASPADIARARAAYYGLCAFVDHQVEQVLAALDRSGLRQQTLVIYTSDHGDQIGEHGLWWKSTFYDGSARVPLLMAGPGLPAGVVADSNVSLIDIGPTLLDVVGLPALPMTDGRSLRHLLEGRTDARSIPVIADGMSVSLKPCPMRMVREGPWKLNIYYGGRPELHNLAEDPDELHDRHADPECRLVLERLMRAACTNWDPDALARRMRNRETELAMLRAHLLRENPPEPDALWFSSPQENWVRAEDGVLPQREDGTHEV